ncbi:unnamed protein product, partial [Durusdinium trenchii]
AEASRPSARAQQAQLGTEAAEPEPERHEAKFASLLEQLECHRCEVEPLNEELRRHAKAACQVRGQCGGLPATPPTTPPRSEACSQQNHRLSTGSDDSTATGATSLPPLDVEWNEVIQQSGRMIGALPMTPRISLSSISSLSISAAEETKPAPATPKGRPSDATVPPSPEDVLEDWDIEEQEPETSGGDFLMLNMPAFRSEQGDSPCRGADPWPCAEEDCPSIPLKTEEHGNSPWSGAVLQRVPQHRAAVAEAAYEEVLVFDWEAARLADACKPESECGDVVELRTDSTHVEFVRLQAILLSRAVRHLRALNFL